MSEPNPDEVNAIVGTLKGADPAAYARALQSLQRQPQVFDLAKPAILQALSGADGTQRFDLAFALAALGSRDPAVLGILAETASPLSAIDALEPFCEAPRIDRVRVTEDSQVKGELVVDSMGTPFLTPEEDQRGGGMGAVRLVAWSHDASGHRRGEAVKVTGYFKAGVGMLVERAWSAGADSG